MKRFPLINFTIYFIAGIILGYLFDFAILTTAFILGGVIFLYIVLYLFKSNLALKNLSSLLLPPAILLIGVLHFQIEQMKPAFYPFEKERIKGVEVAGEVVKFKLPNGNKITAEINTDSIQIDGKYRSVNLNLLCNFNFTSGKLKNALLESVGIGSKIEVTGTLYRPRNQRNPGEFDYEKYLNQKDISAILSFSRKDSFEVLEYDSNLLKSNIYSLRLKIDEILKYYHLEETAALLRGLLLADRSEIDFDTRDQFVNSGVIHVLAVSGLHVGFIVLIFFVLSSRFNLYFRSFITIFGLVFFVLLTGAPASVLRASLMAIAVIAAFLTARSTNGFNSLAVAALIILIIDPGEIFNPGFQLSFSAVFSILVFVPYSTQVVNKYNIQSKILKYYIIFCIVSLAAQIGTLPFTIIYFNKFSAIALLANMVVIPLIGLIVVTGIFTLLISQVSAWIADIFASANDAFVYLLYHLVHFGGEFEYSHFKIFQFSILDGIIFYAITAATFFVWKRLQSGAAKLILFAFVVSIFAIGISFDNEELLPDGSLSIVAIDIGQGDATLIKFPNSKIALIDAGNKTPSFDNGERIVFPLLQRLGIDTIDIAFISHVDADHYRGFFYLFDKGIIQKVYKPIADTSVKKDRELEQFLRESDIPFEYYHRDVISIGEVKLYIFNDTLANNYNSMNENDKSGIIKLIYGESEFLFVGDASIKIESRLIEQFGSLLQADLLKVGHHGSKTSSSEELLKIVNPRFANISAGIGNQFNHPNEIVIERLVARGIKMQRIDLSGAVIYRSDGKSIEIIDWRD